MSKHTPGPWYVQKRWFIKGNDDSVIAKVHPWDETGCRDEDHANARLIAASVDLLEACKSLIWCFDRGLPPGSIGEKICIEAKAAIAKAEGNDNG